MKKRSIMLFLAACLLFVSCEDAPVTDVPPPPPEITVDSPWQFSITVDGSAFSARDSSNNYFGTYSTSGLISPFPDTSALIYHSGLSNDTINTNSLYIVKGTLRFASGMIPPDSIFTPFFATGTYAYSDLATDGIVIEWYDANGELWSTDAGSGIQTGSNFSITNVKTSHNNGYLDVRLKATFNCKLYNSTTGQIKTLTGGTYVGSFEAI